MHYPVNRRGPDQTGVEPVFVPQAIERHLPDEDLLGRRGYERQLGLMSKDGGPRDIDPKAGLRR